jgi:hypothetical protein
MLASIMSSETRKHAWSLSVSNQDTPWRRERLGRWKKIRKDTDPFDGPAEDGCLKEFRLCQLAALEDSD